MFVRDKSTGPATPHPSEPKRHGRWRTVRGWLLEILGIPLIILLLFAVFLIYVEIREVQNQGDAPASVVRAFCQAEVDQRYDAAYAQLSPDYRFTRPYARTLDGFIAANEQRDQQHGPVLGCTVLGRDYTYYGADTAGMIVRIQMGDGTHEGTVGVMRGDLGRWGITRLPADFHLEP